jgi:hypothetical protein
VYTIAKEGEEKARGRKERRKLGDGRTQLQPRNLSYGKWIRMEGFNQTCARVAKVVEGLRMQGMP